MCTSQEGCLHVQVGSCQNYGPFLGTLNNRCRIIIGTQKGTIILTTTQVTATSPNPEALKPKAPHWWFRQDFGGLGLRVGKTTTASGRREISSISEAGCVLLSGLCSHTKQRGSMHATIMELGPQNHRKDGLLGPYSRMVVVLDPLGLSEPDHHPVNRQTADSKAELNARPSDRRANVGFWHEGLGLVVKLRISFRVLFMWMPYCFWDLETDPDIPHRMPVATCRARLFHWRFVRRGTREMLSSASYPCGG